MELKISNERNFRSQLEAKDAEIYELWETITFLNTKIEDAIPSPMEINIRYICLEMIRTEGKFLAAIKKYREVTNASLKDALEYMTILRDEIISGKYGEYHVSLRLHQ